MQSRCYRFCIPWVLFEDFIGYTAHDIEFTLLDVLQLRHISTLKSSLTQKTLYL